MATLVFLAVLGCGAIALVIATVVATIRSAPRPVRTDAEYDTRHPHLRR